MIQFIGMDFETSGTDPWGKAAPIQIGLTTGDEHFESLIGGWDFNTEYEWSERSEAIHGIPLDALRDAPRIHEVDVRAAAWLYDVKTKDRMWTVTVGWNVAGFDRQFITRHFPNVNRLLSYRTVDLNALVFSLAQNEADYVRIKGEAKAHADSALGITAADRHDALVDARAALIEFDYLTGLSVVQHYTVTADLAEANGLPVLEADKEETP